MPLSQSSGKLSLSAKGCLLVVVVKAKVKAEAKAKAQTHGEAIEFPSSQQQADSSSSRSLPFELREQPASSIVVQEGKTRTDCSISSQPSLLGLSAAAAAAAGWLPGFLRSVHLRAGE